MSEIVAWIGSMLALVAAVVLVPGAAAAAEPVALVLAVEGVAEDAPPQAFTEIADGAVVTLAARARLTFLHYRRCEEVTVQGGADRVATLRFAADGFAAEGGRVVERLALRCPQLVQLDPADQTAGLMMRGLDALAVPLEPRFAVVGRRADRVVRVRLWRGDRKLAEIDPATPRFGWPADGIALRNGARYRLELLDADGEAIANLALAPHPDDGGMVLLRVD